MQNVAPNECEQNTNTSLSIGARQLVYHRNSSPDISCAFELGRLTEKCEQQEKQLSELKTLCAKQTEIINSLQTKLELQQIDINNLKQIEKERTERYHIRSMSVAQISQYNSGNHED